MRIKTGSRPLCHLRAPTRHFFVSHVLMKLASCTPQLFSSRISFGKKGQNFPLLSVHFPFVGFSGSHLSIKLKPLGSVNLSTKVFTISESTLMFSNISGSPPSKLWKDYTSLPHKTPHWVWSQNLPWSVNCELKWWTEPLKADVPSIMFCLLYHK